MPMCFVKNCGNYYGKTKKNSKVIYHMLPTSNDLALKWTDACGQDKNQPPVAYARVCSDHFSENCYQRDLQHELLGLPLRRKLKPNAIPDTNLPKKTVTQETKSQTKPKTKEINRKQMVSTNNKIIVTNNKVTSTNKVLVNHKVNSASNKLKPILQEIIEKQQINKQANVSQKVINKTEDNKLKENNKSYMKMSKNNIQKDYRIPMRSSIRIAKKKSIECLSDSFTETVNSKSRKVTKADKFSDKLKFLAKLQLRYATCGEKMIPVSEIVTEAQVNFLPLPTYDLSKSLGKIIPEAKRHFSDDSYERDVQHELLGLPTRCRLKKGAIPERNLPTDFLKEEVVPESAIAILLAVGLVPANKNSKTGGLPQDLNKMQIMEDVREGGNIPPSSPGHAEQRSTETMDQNISIKPEDTGENGYNAENLSENGFKHTNSNGHPHEEEDDLFVKNESRIPKEEKKSDSEIEDKNEDNLSSGSSTSENGSNKRKSQELEDSPIKRLKKDLHQHFNTRDKIINDFIEMSETNTLDQIQTMSEQVLSEIKTLNEIAREKEREWNNIIHLKKLKEELLIRMQRKRQLLLLNETNINQLSDINMSSFQQSLLKANQKSSTPNIDKSKMRTILPKPNQFQIQQQLDLDFRQKQRATLDVQSIIKDYRQRHPETVPRRGRRIRYSQTGDEKNLMSPTMFGTRGNGKAGNGTGSDVTAELGLLINSMNGSRDSSRNSDETMPQHTSFKDMLVQFAKLSQSERNELIQNAIKPPPPYPEVTVHPVPTTTAPPTNSLLHGILTKTPTKQQKNDNHSNNSSKTSFSPTLARLLTAPERSSSTPSALMSGGSIVHPSNMSISEILSTSKARNEITITPVSQMESSPSKGESLIEEESEENADRLIIDESSDNVNLRKDDNSSDAEDIPQCQGCNEKSAQFVCAGCGNQWYCSRECQVTAWDEHSEVCSG